MLLQDFLDSVSYTLQDADRVLWTEGEIMLYINEGMRNIASKTFFYKQTEEIALDPLVNDYSLTYEPVRIESLKCDVDAYMSDNQTVTVTEPVSGVTATVAYYAVPTETLFSDDNIVMPYNVEEALRNFVLMRCYEKDATEENFRKSEHYERKYINAVSENGSWNAPNEITSVTETVVYNQDYLV